MMKKGALSSLIHRMFGFGRRHDTEQIQQTLLMAVSSRGRTTMPEVIQHFFQNWDADMARFNLVQAAQILVNRGELVALIEKRRVDPVSISPETVDKIVFCFPEALGKDER